MNLIDNFLNSITMYRLILYYLIGLLVIAFVFGFFGILPINPITLLLSTLFLIIVCWVTNIIFSKTFNAPTNIESLYISALILALIVSPAASLSDVFFLFWAAVLTMASKYIFAISKKHIFNPVAIAVVLTSIGFNGSASWWIGTASMAPFVVIGGLLITRKIRREDLVFSFFVAALTTVLVFSLISGNNLLSSIQRIFLESSLLFLAFVMLTEPLTTPPAQYLRIIYGGIVGFLFAPQVHIAGFYTTPEIALCIGNVFSYLVSPKHKLVLMLKQKLQYGKDIVDFSFFITQKLSYLPGQYMEWTLPHSHPDSRGNRRYFTIASSPTENTLHLGVKFYPDGSSFKKALVSLDQNTPIVGAQLSGEFTLPKDPNKKLIFIAGGIGVTPFRSMIKYLIDKNEKRVITLFYSNKTLSEITYYDVFYQAKIKLGIETVCTLTDLNQLPSNWKGLTGPITAEMIQTQAPDYRERIFYISGPHGMVTAFEKILHEMGVRKSQIKTDYFPGFT